jgi:cytochrome b6-f complex iron-sulfur subunit
MENYTSIQGPISRAQFLKSMGITGAALVAALCMGGLASCSKSDVKPSGSKDFTINLDEAAYTSLKTVGNFLVVQEVVVVCTAANTYVAVTVICSHEGQKQVAYRKASNDFYCSAHGANFDINGKGKNSTGSGGLTVYKAVLTGNNLRISS